MSEPKIVIIPIGPQKHAAQMGLKLGGYLLLVYLCWMYAPTLPLLSILCLLGLLATPIVAYRLGKRYRDYFPEEAPYPFALAWSHGVQMFLFAGVILLLPTYYYYTKALPSQIPLIESTLTQSFAQQPELKELIYANYGGNPIDMIYKLIDRSALWGNLWTGFSSTVFLGSITSIFTALVLRRTARNTH